MGVEDIKDGATNPILPWIGEVDLSVQLVVGLVVGGILWKMLDPLSESLADAVASKVADLTGINPQTGDTNSGGPAFGGGSA